MNGAGGALAVAAVAKAAPDGYAVLTMPECGERRSDRKAGSTLLRHQ
jgi:hypothetical protein